uniref:adenylate cyclase n=1 Tax=Ascaris suum TaxID=6253 RepID=F1KYD6_ASCSU
MAGFGDGALEALYQKSLLSHTRAQLLHLLCVYTAAVLLLALIHLSEPDLILLLSSLEAALSLILQAVLLARPSLSRFVIYATVQLLVLTSVFLYPSAHSALLPAVLSIFAIYALLPLKLQHAIAISVLLSVSQLAALIFFASTLTINQFLASGLIHLWTHFIGFYASSTRDRISRGAFLRARNAFTAEERAIQENTKLTDLLSTAVPPHLIHGIREHFTKTPPTLYTEHYSQVTIVYGRLIGLEEIFAQCSPQDGARLLNEFNSRIDQIAKKCSCLRLQSDGILVVAGLPNITDEHTRNAITFAIDLHALVKSFCDSTTAELGLRCGIESGSISAGIVGITKWHYDIIGSSLDEAINIERTATQCGIFLAENAKRQIESDEFTVEKCERNWCIIPQGRSNLPSSILFPNLRRYSLVTVPQAVNRLLQTIASTSDSLLKTNALPGRRKKKMEKLLSVGDKLEDKRDQGKSLMHSCTLRFRNPEMEAAFHTQLDQWFIPALAISIFFLVVYGVYHVLVLPRQIATLVLIVVALAAMFIILLILYINYFQNFCHFITRTAIGHSTAILLILALLFICGIVNTFSCPQKSDLADSSECYVVHYSLLSCAIWMLATVVFIRFSAMVLLCALLIAFLLYSLHVFVTHPMLYIGYSQITQSHHVEWELLVGLLTLIALIFLQARRNERILRLEFMSKLKVMPYIFIF